MVYFKSEDVVGTRVSVLKGLYFIRRGVLDREKSVSDLYIVLAPLSREYLLETEVYREFFRLYRDRTVVIPSSYDDPSIYRILSREHNIKICWSEKPCVSIPVSVRRAAYLSREDLVWRGAREIVFIERSLRVDNEFWRDYPRRDMGVLDRIVVYHGTSDPIGISIDSVARVSLPYNYQGMLEVCDGELVMRILYMERSRDLVEKRVLLRPLYTT